MDELPNVTRPEEFNRVLVCLAESDSGLSIPALLDVLTSTTCQGLLPDHSETIRAAAGARLVRLKSGRVSMAPLGERLLALNPEGCYELAPGQARFLYTNLIQQAPYAQAARSLFALFRSRGREKGFSLDLDSVALSRAHGRLLSILRRLGVIDIYQGTARVTAEYQAEASAARARRTLSADELEELLLRQKMRGAAAESVVLEMERTRLRAAGHPIEAEAVSLISDVDVAAGYDLESFDGASATLKPDRFIEVKSTASSDGQFFWSENERATAQHLREKYWIYHLRAFSLEEMAGAGCVLINNPVAMVKAGTLKLTCAQHKVTFDVDADPFSGYTDPFILRRPLKASGS